MRHGLACGLRAASHVVSYLSRIPDFIPLPSRGLDATSPSSAAAPHRCGCCSSHRRAGALPPGLVHQLESAAQEHRPAHAHRHDARVRPCPRRALHLLPRRPRRGAARLAELRQGRQAHQEGGARHDAHGDAHQRRAPARRARPAQTLARSPLRHLPPRRRPPAPARRRHDAHARRQRARRGRAALPRPAAARPGERRLRLPGGGADRGRALRGARGPRGQRARPPQPRRRVPSRLRPHPGRPGGRLPAEGRLRGCHRQLPNGAQPGFDLRPGQDAAPPADPGRRRPVAAMRERSARFRDAVKSLLNLPVSTRYETIPYQRCGRSGLKLPVIALGLWHNFGGVDRFGNARAMIHRAFDLGITHFDLANNYGPPPGSAERTFGRILRRDLRRYRDELIISTKAGWGMWAGPYGDWGSRKYLLASLDQSLRRMGLDYVDIFYHHRPDPETPLEETMGALDHAVRSGKALYAGVSSYQPPATREAAAILKSKGIHLLIHQPVYSMLNRWIEPELLDVLEQEGVGCIAFSPLSLGMLTDLYLQCVPACTRATEGYSLTADTVNQNTARVRALHEIAQRRAQKLSQMALAWVLRDPSVTSAIVGVSSVSQLEENLGALDNRSFTPEELAEIDRITKPAT